MRRQLLTGQTVAPAPQYCRSTTPWTAMKICNRPLTPRWRHEQMMLRHNSVAGQLNSAIAVLDGSTRLWSLRITNLRAQTFSTIQRSAEIQ